EVHDTAGATRWDTWTSSTANCTREMYWDDTTALGHKYDLVVRNHLRGIGIWTLSYGGGAPELWSLINLKFGQCSPAGIAAAPRRTAAAGKRRHHERGGDVSGHAGVSLLGAASRRSVVDRTGLRQRIDVLVERDTPALWRLSHRRARPNDGHDGGLREL